MNSKSSESRLVSLLAGLVRGEGTSPSLLPGVKFMHTTRHIPRAPIAYEPGIFVVAQGRKTGYLGTRKIVYDANHYLAGRVGAISLRLLFVSQFAPDIPASVSQGPAGIIFANHSGGHVAYLGDMQSLASLLVLASKSFSYSVNTINNVPNPVHSLER